MIERIHFGVPQIGQLKEEGFFLADMHFHSKYSDTFTRPKMIVRKAAKKGIGVSITDHNHIQGCIDALEENKKYNVPIIPGIEVSTKQGPHLLTYFYSIKDMKYFYNKYIKNHKRKNPYMALNMDAEKLAEGARNNNGIVSIAHPRSVITWDLQSKILRGAIDKSILKDIQCAEVICGLIIRKMNLRAVEWAKERKMGITGGSDGHTLIKLGSVVTYSKSDSIESFLDSLVKKKTFVAGTETKMLPRALSYSKAITKHSRFVGPSVSIHSKLYFKDNYVSLKNRIINRNKISSNKSSVRK